MTERTAYARGVAILSFIVLMMVVTSAISSLKRITISPINTNSSVNLSSDSLGVYRSLQPGMCKILKRISFRWLFQQDKPTADMEGFKGKVQGKWFQGGRLESH